MSFRIVNEKSAADEGIDRIAISDSLFTSGKYIIQCKDWKSPVGEPITRDLYGVVISDGANKGIAITTGSFDRYDEEFSIGKPIELIDGDYLVELLVEYGIGITRKDVVLVALGREALDGEPEVPEFEVVDIEDDRAEEFPEPVKYKHSKIDDRVASIWPLPGGADKYADTLFLILSLIIRENPTLEEVAEWFVMQFPNVSSKRTTRCYLQVLRGMGLIRYEGEEIQVTSAGAELAASQSIDMLRRILEEKILGVREIEELLVNEPATAAEVHQYLIDRLNLGWSTSAQTEWRLSWLECVGSIRKKGEEFVIVDTD